MAQLAVQIQPKPYVVKELEIDGRRPFAEWFRRLKDKEAKAAILGRLARIAEYGNFGDYRSLGEGIFELRVHRGPGYRVYFGLEHGQIVLLLLGGDKSSQERDVTKAKKLWERYAEE
jgi:putative addiction module killer protein